MEEKNEQDVVLEIKDKSLIVSASAGSGKTSTMIRKIFNTIFDNKVDISNLLVLTYTNAAAAEMKSRLNEFLLNKIAESDDREFLQKQVNKLSIADISTFHSFYEKLIKANYYLLNINPSFVIADDSESKILKENAFSLAINQFKVDEEKYLKLFSAFNKKRNETALFNRILKLQDFLSAEIDDEKWLDEISLSMINNLNLPKEILNDYYNQNISYTINNFEELLKIAVMRSQDKIAAHCNARLSELNSVLSLDILQKQQRLTDFSFQRFVKGKDDDPELVENLKSIKKIFSKFAKNVKDENINMFAENGGNLAKIKEKYQIFIEFYKKYIQILNELKNNNSIYDFADIEKMALKLLQILQVESAVKEQYKYVFVDEFQDVNTLQNEILKHLCNRNNVFIVGDPKQSIYAFRQSDVSIFTDTVKNFRENEFAEDRNLKNNYRSNEKILEFCNIVFSNIMTEKTAGLDYTSTSKFQPYAKIPTEFAPVNILLCNKKSKSEERALELYKVFDAPTKKISYSEEAIMIFDEICKLLDRQIYDDKLKAFRKIKYSDITILVRSRGNLSDSLANIFEDNGVPYMLNAEKDLKKSKLVLALISALTLATDYYSDIDYTVFLNRFCALSFDEMAKIKLKSNEENFFVACLRYLEENKEDQISEKLKLCEYLIDNFKIKIEIEGAYKSLNWLVKNSKFLDFANEIENFEEEKQMMQSFLNFVETSKYNDNLIMLLNLINENSTLKVEQNLSSGLDKINITTIHASKGLEYNIVFLAGLGKSIFKNMPNASDIKIDKNLGIALKINEDENISLFEKAIKIKERSLDLAESLRLLYVGMTRAKNHLYLTAQGDFDDIVKVSENNLTFVDDNYMTYILGSLGERQIDAINAHRDIEEKDFTLRFINDFEERSLDNELPLSEIQKENVIENIEKLSRFDFKSELSTLAQKTSVSEIIKDENEYESLNIVPNTLQITEHLQGIQSGVEIGNAFHEIMERANFETDLFSLKNICQDVFEKYLENGVQLESDFVELSSNLCFKALKEIKQIVGDSKIYKEKKFMINASPMQVLNSGSTEKVLIQGVIDFFALGDKVTLIDYKYSFINNDEKLKAKYKNQLKIYSFALEQYLNRKVDKMYLLNLRNGHLIEL